MSQSQLEIADIFRTHGVAWRADNKGHIGLSQMKVMSAMRALPQRLAVMLRAALTAPMSTSHTIRAAIHCAAAHACMRESGHCQKSQAGVAKAWLAAREAELLPVRYFHLVFTLPKQIADIAHQNKRQICNLLMRASADTVIRIAADPKHLGARIGITSVLHTWGSAMTHHPHVIARQSIVSQSGERGI